MAKRSPSICETSLERMRPKLGSLEPSFVNLLGVAQDSGAETVKATIAWLGDGEESDAEFIPSITINLTRNH